MGLGRALGAGQVAKAKLTNRRSRRRHDLTFLNCHHFQVKDGVRTRRRRVDRVRRRLSLLLAVLEDLDRLERVEYGHVHEALDVRHAVRVFANFERRPIVDDHVPLFVDLFVACRKREEVVHRIVVELVERQPNREFNVRRQDDVWEGDRVRAAAETKLSWLAFINYIN